MESIRFSGEVRYWSPERASGLAVIDVPEPQARALGGLKQARVRGRIGATEFTSNVMPAGGGRLAMSVSKALMTAAGLRIGGMAEVEISSVGRD